jgi:hypothetical protein
MLAVLVSARVSAWWLAILLTGVIFAATALIFAERR